MAALQSFSGTVSGTDHAVVIVGYQDDATVYGGGYWIIKNSWGTGSGTNGYYYAPYGAVENHNAIDELTGPVYYNGSMGSATWNGGSAAWTNNGNNWTLSGSAFAWKNTEYSAVFHSTSQATVTVNGPVLRTA